MDELRATSELTRPDVLDLAEVTAPLLVCEPDGTAIAATASCAALLRRFEVLPELPGRLPDPFWAALTRLPDGEAVEWRVQGADNWVIGCTRYRAGDRYVLVMKEVSGIRAELSRRLHRQRLEATGRLVAGIAHELRNSVASINYSTDYLRVAGNKLSEADHDEATADILAASGRLQALVDGLLDYARLGPSISVPVSLRDVLTRSQGFLRGVLRRRDHKLSVDIPAAAEWVQGNTIVIEQIFINLILNAVQAADGRVHIRIFSDLTDVTTPTGNVIETMVRTRVWDDGPGIPAESRDSVFQPFYTTHEQGTGLGLTNARQAAEAMRGRLALEDRPTGACFSVMLPRGERAGGEAT